MVTTSTKTKTRTTKTPLQAAQANADAAIDRLNNLGGRLFTIGKPEHTEALREIVTSLRTLREAL